jgi:GT2 family glycosyltransferase
MIMKSKWKYLLNRWALRHLFNDDFYLENNEDVRSARHNPLKHYLEFGWKELRDPSDSFSTKYYLDSYPDVARSGMNPLLHFARFGMREGRSPYPDNSALLTAADNRQKTPSKLPDSSDFDLALSVIAPSFDADFYLSSYPDVKAAKLDPLHHYLHSGWAEGRNPNPNFQTSFYLDTNDDVRQGGINPFVHYLCVGRNEGRPATSPIIDRIMLKPVAEPWCSPKLLKSDLDISVVIPTYNRSHMLPALLESWRVAHAETRYKYELIFSDDGSEDNSCAILTEAKDLPITLLRNEHGGASAARNAAVRIARGTKILFMGDDIFPDPQIINWHVEKLRELPITAAVLGECVWHPALTVNHLMTHITEVGCEQFSFLALPRNAYTDFRHFYTCNISLDREFLLSEKIIFDERFYKCNFEDIELGYRLASKGMKIFFLPDALGYHHHSYSEVRKFCSRQEAAGELARVFELLHPELSHIIPLRKWETSWHSKIESGRTSGFDYYEALIRICQYVDDRHAELAATQLEDLSIVYRALFSFSLEFGYVRTGRTGIPSGITNQIFADLVLTAPVVDALSRLHEVLILPDYNTLSAALADPRSQENSPEQARASTMPTPPAFSSDTAVLTVEVENWDHLQEIAACYVGLIPAISFKLRSESLKSRGWTYAPVRGAHVSRSVLQQLLLLLDRHPELDCIMLSFGLFDIPKIGVRREHGVEMIKTAGQSRRGKVVRVFEGSDVEAVQFEQATNNVFCLPDHHGNFTAVNA